MGDKNPVGDLLIPLMSLLLVLAVSIVLIAKLGTMDLPRRSDLMTVLLPAELVGGEGGGRGRILGYLPLVVLLCAFAALLVALITVSTALSPFPLAGGLFVALGMIAAIAMRVGMGTGAQAVSMGVGIVCVYAAYSAWRKLSVLVQFSSGEMASAAASSFMFAAAVVAALMSYQVVSEDAPQMRDQLLTSLVRPMGYEGAIQCGALETAACVDDMLGKVMGQMARKQVSESLEGQLGCKGPDRLRPCVRGMVRRQMPPGAAETDVERQTEATLQQVLSGYGISGGGAWGERTLDSLVDEVVRSSPQVAREMDKQKEQAKGSIGMLSGMLEYLPVMTAFAVLMTIQFAKVVVAPAASLATWLVFSALLGTGIVRKVERTITVERYVVALGRAEEPAPAHELRRPRAPPRPPARAREPEPAPAEEEGEAGGEEPEEGPVAPRAPPEPQRRPADQAKKEDQFDSL